MNQIIKPDTVDFNALIKNSTNLTISTKSKMIEILNQEFTEEENRWYIANLYIYMNYHPTNDYPINLDTLIKLVDFANKQNAKRTLVNNFIEGEDYKVLLIRKDEQKNTEETRGGHNKEQVMLNIDTFKNMCMLVKTEKSKQIRKYYVKLENIYNKIIKEEIENTKNLLEENKQLLLQKEQDNILDRHNLLLTRYAKTGSIVYFIKVKSFDNISFILKIGQSSIGLEPRYAKHKINYPECIILDCFKVDKALDLELFIHNAVKKSLYTTLQGHEHEKELFLIESEDQYNNLINLVSENIKRFNNNDYVEISDLQKEINRLQNQNNQNNVPECPKIDPFELKKILDNQEKMLALITRQMCNLENLENTLRATINNSNSRTPQEYNTIIKPLQGPKVIQINPDNLQIYKIHNTIIDLIKLDPHISRTSLKRSVENNTVYKNYRWIFLNRDFEIKNIVILPTQITETRDVGYIAKLNPDKTKIINVFYSMAEAIKINGSISRNDPYYIIYDKCDINLKEHFEEIYGEPLLYKNGLGQFDASGVNLIKDFASKQDCLKKSNISRALLTKLIKDQSSHNGFMYKFIGKKSQFLN